MQPIKTNLNAGGFKLRAGAAAFVPGGAKAKTASQSESKESSISLANDQYGRFFRIDSKGKTIFYVDIFDSKWDAPAQKAKKSTTTSTTKDEIIAAFNKNIPSNLQSIEGKDFVVVLDSNALSNMLFDKLIGQYDIYIPAKVINEQISKKEYGVYFVKNAKMPSKGLFKKLRQSIRTVLSDLPDTQADNYEYCLKVEADDASPERRDCFEIDGIRFIYKFSCFEVRPITNSDISMDDLHVTMGFTNPGPQVSTNAEPKIVLTFHEKEGAPLTIGVKDKFSITADNRILVALLNFKQQDKPVLFVTNDRMLAFKANIFGVPVRRQQEVEATLERLKQKSTAEDMSAADIVTVLLSPPEKVSIAEELKREHQEDTDEQIARQLEEEGKSFNTPTTASSTSDSSRPSSSAFRKPPSQVRQSSFQGNLLPPTPTKLSSPPDDEDADSVADLPQIIGSRLSVKDLRKHRKYGY